jgi:predicted nucleic acid-binding protein
MMLLDTSGLLCLLHRPEPFHAAAVQAYRAAHARLTHGYVLAEFVALATARRLPRADALSLSLRLDG